MKRMAVAALLGAAVAVAIVVATGSAKGPSGTTLHLIEKGGSFHYVDEPPTAPPHTEEASAGDRFVFTSGLYTRANKRAGTLYADCTVVSGGKKPSLNCVGTFGLAGGLLSLATRIRGFEAKVTKIAITGGTGAYEGARGSIVSISGPHDTSRDTIHLLP